MIVGYSRASTTAGPAFTVSGAGTSSANGNYYLMGNDTNGNPYYKNANNIYIYWYPSEWCIGPTLGGAAPSQCYYYIGSGGSLANGPSVGTWIRSVTGGGSLPVPTVTVG